MSFAVPFRFANRMEMDCSIRAPTHEYFANDKIVHTKSIAYGMKMNTAETRSGNSKCGLQSIYGL